MKVIFLDFDGVINSYQSEFVDPECVGVLSSIIEETNAKVVATTASRYPVLEGKVDYLESDFYRDYVKTLQTYGIMIDEIKTKSKNKSYSFFPVLLVCTK